MIFGGAHSFNLNTYYMYDTPQEYQALVDYSSGNEFAKYIRISGS